MGLIAEILMSDDDLDDDRVYIRRGGQKFFEALPGQESGGYDLLRKGPVPFLAPIPKAIEWDDYGDESFP